MGRRLLGSSLVNCCRAGGQRQKALALVQASELLVDAFDHELRQVLECLIPGGAQPGLPLENRCRQIFGLLVARRIYVRDRDVVVDGREVMSSPLTVFHWGGDCEDYNLTLLGGLFRQQGATGLAACFWPTVSSARHVFLRGLGYDWDVVPPPGFYETGRYLECEAVRWKS